MMGMAQQLMAPQPSADGGANTGMSAGMAGTPTGANPNFGANPMMSAMMQQMMAPAAPGANAELGVPGAPPLPSVMLRARFAGQLAQLSAMGFSNEEACLRALQQHNGRLDSAIEALIASDDGSA